MIPNTGGWLRHRHCSGSCPRSRAIRAAGGIAGLHSCALVGLDRLSRTGPDILSFDALDGMTPPISGPSRQHAPARPQKIKGISIFVDCWYSG